MGILQNETLVISLLAGMGVLVLVLVTTLLVMTKSSRATKTAAEGEGKKAKADAAPSEKAASEGPGAGKPGGAEKPGAEKPATGPTVKEKRGKSKSSKSKPPKSAPLEMAAELPKGLNTTAEPDAEADITRMTAFSAPKHLPRLSVDSDEDDEDDGMNVEESKANLLYESEAEIDIEEPTGPHEVILMAASGQTDRGVLRRRNEDAYVIDTNMQLYAVADGMGGYAGGDIASSLAIRELRAALENPGELHGPKDRPRRGRELIAAVERANTAVYLEAHSKRDLQGMGTTIVAARFSPQKQRMYLAHVGDSRCYRLRAGTLQMLTKDHTLASRGVVGPLGSNICRAVGVAKTVKVDLIIDKPLPDDVFLFCSDGLPKMVSDDQIRQILTAHQGSLDKAASQLVLTANASGGRDNITIVLVGILEITATTRTAAVVRRQRRVEFGPS